VAAGCGDSGVVYAEGGEGDEWVRKISKTEKNEKNLG